MRKDIGFLIFISVFACVDRFSFRVVNDPKVNWNELSYLGFKNIDELNLKKEKTNLSKNHQKLNKAFYNFLYRNYFVIQTDSPADISSLYIYPSQNWDLYYTIVAIENIIQRHPKLYEKLVAFFFHYEIPKDYKLENKPWVNQYEKIIISFNDGMDSIAEMMIAQDENPTPTNFKSEGIYLYRNFLLIYVYQKVIHTKHESIGAYPYYKLETDEENYHTYMNDGFYDTILHELLHGYVKQLNYRKNTLYNAFYENDRLSGRSEKYDQGLYDYEEILVTRTLNKYFKKYGGISKVIVESTENTEKKIKQDIGEKKLNRYRLQFKNTENFLSDDSLDILEK